jgi:hypothetical protein
MSLFALFILFPAYSFAQNYNYEQKDELTLNQDSISFKIISPSCWSVDKIKADCPKTLNIFLSNSTDYKIRKAYQIKIRNDGFVSLIIETKKGLFNWKAIEGIVQGGCKTGCKFTLPLNKIQLKEFMIWYADNHSSKIEVEGKLLPPTISPNYNYIKIINGSGLEPISNPFFEANAKGDLLAGCKANVKNADACNCYVQQFMENQNIKMLITKLANDYNLLIVNDLYFTLKESWWKNYMNKKAPDAADLKGGAILVSSLNAGMSCAQAESLKRTTN